MVLNSTQLKFIEKGSRMAKRIQYIKTNQMIKVLADEAVFILAWRVVPGVTAFF